MGLYFRDRVSIDFFFTFVVPIGSVFVRVPIFSILAKFTRTMNKLDMSVMSDDSSAVLNHHLLL